jgi:hypothetical protein
VRFIPILSISSVLGSVVGEYMSEEVGTAVGELALLFSLHPVTTNSIKGIKQNPHIFLSIFVLLLDRKHIQ